MHINIFWTLIAIFFLINTIASVITVFRKQRTIAATLAWLIVLIGLPGIGFILYAFLGRGLAQDNIFNINSQSHVGLERLNSVIDDNSHRFNDFKNLELNDETKRLINYFNVNNDNPLTVYNKVQFYTDGKEKFRDLFKDIENAKETIHVEYYSIFNDELGNKFMNLLVKKAQEGLEVRVIYDPWGSFGSSRRWFRQFEEQGVQVEPFATSRNAISKTRLNYHLHRKIVVIDGIVGWIGGFNVGDQYIGENKKFGNWRDTHARIRGSAAFNMQERFIMDWNASVTNGEKKVSYQDLYFPFEQIERDEVHPIQIISDGPDSEVTILKGGFVQLINNASNYIYLQTPYLIPDDTIIDSLLVAHRSGVKIKIMIPDGPDHPFIYRATQYYANIFTRNGIEVYNYHDGFMHAKTAIIDGKVAMVGSMNQDFRSYALNFEANAYFYDEELTKQVEDTFIEDLKNSTLITQKQIDNQSKWLTFKQYFSRLLSPIL